MATLPSNKLIDIYISYKRTTKIALDWLSSQVCSLESWTSNGTFRSTREIIDCAKCLPENHEVPSYVITALRDAIGARRRVHQSYKELHANSSDTSTPDPDDAHEAFIARLEETLQILQSKTNSVQSHRKHSPHKESQNSQSYNRFVPLDSTGDSDGNAMEAEDTAWMTNTNKDRPTKTETEILDRHCVLQDDDLGGWIEFHYLICSLDAILDQSNKNWAEAANGTLPICVAAWLSSTAFHEVGRRYKEFDYDALLLSWTTHRMKQIEIRFSDVPGLHSETRRFMDPQRLSYHRSLLQQYRTLQDEVKDISLDGRFVDPSGVVTPLSQDDRQSAFNDYLAMFVILGEMRQLLASKRAIAAIETTESPQSVCEQILPLADKVFSDTTLPIHVQLIFGLEILLSSYKAYMWPDAVLNRQSCRILVLQLALEVQAAFSDTIKCIQETPESMSILNLPYLQNVSDGLEGYTKEIRFDLYHQAPWTSGCHMVEIVTVAMFEGLHLCCDTGYLCALLHLYNALRRIDSNFRRIKLLEQLCEIFLDKLFLGNFPTRNFSSCFRRAMGSRLDRRAKPERNSQMEFSKAIPGFSKRNIGSTRLSEFYDLHTFGYEPSADFWHLAFQAKSRWQPTTRREQEEAMRRAYSSPLTVSLEKAKESVIEEFHGPLPVARVNYLAIFIFSANLMEKLCTFFTAVKEQKAHPDRDLGFEVVDCLLVQIVDHLHDDKRELLLPYWRPVNNAKFLFNELDGDLCLDQFLWKSGM